MKVFTFCFITFLFGLNSGCNHGLEPYRETAGFGGTIIYRGNWPSPDSVIIVRLIASKISPPFNIDTVFVRVLRGDSVFLFPPDLNLIASLPKDTTQTSYEFFLPPGTYKYVAVAILVCPDILSTQCFRIVGVLTENQTTFEPKKLIVPLNTFIRNQNIVVDYENLPPQPFDSKRKK
ncbi:MAG: hypothetical protein KGZ58_13165 [Ignavibacteriales bacterium]|nr:hypothetical protein [Ignavibacteriales bacterium]